MKALKPTVMPAVPRLLNRIYDKVVSQVSGSFIKRTLYNMALGAKESELKRCHFIFRPEVLFGGKDDEKPFLFFVFSGESFEIIVCGIS